MSKPISREELKGKKLPDLVYDVVNDMLEENAYETYETEIYLTISEIKKNISKRGIDPDSIKNLAYKIMTQYESVGWTVRHRTPDHIADQFNPYLSFS